MIIKNQIKNYTAKIRAASKKTKNNNNNNKNKNNKMAEM